VTATAPSAKLAEGLKRTAAATLGLKRKKAHRLAVECSARVWLLDDEYLSRLAFVALAECQRRGVTVWSEDE
jgi:hypothetical protein